jgi:[1-hydroxy-2-(trimethylamino)ethyl]phosphonate dioxygenase
MTDERILQIQALLEDRADGQYGLHDVTQRQHALQAAMFAESDSQPIALVTAALLHDVGHLVHDLGDNPASQGIDDRHEQVGHDFLTRWFGPDVTEPVRLHVAAKRFLCATEPDYFGKLSKDSVLSLSLQGGRMSDAEVAAFRDSPYWRQAVQLRRYDEMAKVKDLPTPPVRHFLAHVAACLAQRL